GSRRRHGVCGELGTADAETRTGMLLDTLEIFTRYPAGAERTYCLERRDDRKVLALPLARFDRPSVDIDRRYIAECPAHQTARLVLVAAGDAQEAVHLMATPSELNASGDLLARRE